MLGAACLFHTVHIFLTLGHLIGARTLPPVSSGGQILLVGLAFVTIAFCVNLLDIAPGKVREMVGGGGGSWYLVRT